MDILLYNWYAHKDQLVKLGRTWSVSASALKKFKNLQLPKAWNNFRTLNFKKKKKLKILDFKNFLRLERNVVFSCVRSKAMTYLAPAHSSRQELVTWMNSLELDFEEKWFKFNNSIIMINDNDGRGLPDWRHTVN